MSFKLLACAAVVVAAAATTTGAQAGGGTRLPFGFPLGSFTATPAKGGGASKAYASKARKSAVQQAARKAEPKPSRIAKAERKSDHVAKHEPVTKQDTVTEKAETPAEDAAPRLTGSSALIGQSVPAETGNAGSATPEASAPADSKSADAACTKFVPALGTTVPVDCGK